MMKLHIGSRTRTDGWKTLDIAAGPEVDFVGNCSDLSRFADGSVEAIYASHVLEHIPFREMDDTLKEWYRALKPGKTAMISVPDLETLCRLYVHPQTSPQDRIHLMEMMFGAQTDAHDFHRIGFNAELIAYYLHRAKFAKIVRVKDFGLFRDTSTLEFRGVPISLNVTAVKPVNNSS